MISQNLLIVLAAAPLVGALIAGLGRKQVGRAGAAAIAILSVAISFALSCVVFWQLVWGGAPVFNHDVYTWLEVGKLSIGIGFLVDRLTALMLVTVTFVSLMVHVYTIGYMRDDPGFQRFFAYIALFTFSMLMLVLANNFLQLFIGWELVGLVSYLLIGFWFERPSASFAALKAFIVNRVGDFGFILGIAAVLYAFHTLDYSAVFAQAPDLAGRTIEIVGGHPWSLATLICLLLFVGACGKSAQVPLHVWLPDSMEGPTPISALIHAATMVTAGIFMVARMSPLYEMSTTALSVVLIVGATTAFFMGLIGIVQNDIKRVIAYSTLSQLGYMVVALGVSAYAAGIFHLMTHAFFKALLFLGAGSVIVAMHHEQDMRYMGGLRKRMPITWITMWIGSLALVATPGFSGFYSKDQIIEAVGESQIFGATYAYWCVLLGVFVTALYSFRLLYMTFHGKERFKVEHGHDDHAHHQPGVLAHAPRESPWVITVPLVLLAIPSVIIGWFTIEPLLYGGWFGESIKVLPGHDVLAKMAEEFHGPAAMFLHSFTSAPFWIAVAGFAVATWVYLFNPGLADRAARTFLPVFKMLTRKYWVDEVYYNLFARGGVKLGRAFWKGGDAGLIDGAMVNGSASLVERSSRVLRRLQTGFLYHYAFVMIVGLILLLGGLWYWGLR
ncbi:MAG: NADH-quinone oxidoreductase subunit L [Lysobacterales bacterium 66-474]|nr:MAG: NADH-quinone oxidoreductase subunit L [Rhodanobacter sp. SCN 66-43]OJY83247.1 MAG: NADH-quinone oxidoreductase subunit L [Xanthomonadales bacterium 66-474]